MNLDEFYKKYNSSPSKLARAIGLKTTEDLENFMNTLKKLTIETNGEVDLYETALYNNLSLSDKIIDLIYANIENKVINVKEIAYFLNLSRFVVNRKISLRKFNTKELIKISSYIQKKESQSMKKNKKLLKTVVGLGALGIFCFSSSAKASVNQYFELQTGVNFGKNSIGIEKAGDQDLIHGSIYYTKGHYTYPSNTNNFNLGYGINFQRKLDPTHAVSFANGVSLGLSAGLTTSGKLYHIIIPSGSGTTAGYSTIYNHTELGNKRSYNLMLTGGLDILKIKSYHLSVTGGAGVAMNSWYANQELYRYKVEMTYEGFEEEKYHFWKKSTSNKLTFIGSLGLKQEFFVTKNVSLGLETNYSYLGKYKADIEDSVLDVVTKEGEHENEGFPGVKDVKVNLGGQFTANLGVKFYF